MQLLALNILKYAIQSLRPIYFSNLTYVQLKQDI